jgi:hypothetical protein
VGIRGLRLRPARLLRSGHHHAPGPLSVSFGHGRFTRFRAVSPRFVAFCHVASDLKSSEKQPSRPFLS